LIRDLLSGGIDMVIISAIQHHKQTRI